jgi:putative endonuclease
MLRCADGSLYTGIATDVARRLVEHESSSRGAKYLRGRGPFELVLQQEIGDRCAASQVEYRLKALLKSEKEDLIAGRRAFAEFLPEFTATQASGAGGG